MEGLKVFAKDTSQVSSPAPETSPLKEDQPTTREDLVLTPASEDTNNVTPSESPEDNNNVTPLTEEEENISPRIIARPSSLDDLTPPVPTPPVVNGPVVRLAKVITKPAKIEKSPEQTPRTPTSVGEVDTTTPLASVKAAVSKFGGIVDWKAHRMQSVERRKVIELELEKAQEEIPLFKKQSQEAEEAKKSVLKELDSTKRLIEELKLNLEAAQTEEEQAKQDAELAKLRVEELERGVTNETSFVAKEQLEVARARHAAAVEDLKAVEGELEQLRRDYAMLVAEKDAYAKKAEEAISMSKEIEKSVEDLTIELINAKESLESAHAGHLEAEERRIAAVMAKDEDLLNWEKELKQAEEEFKKMSEKVGLSNDMKSKLSSAVELLQGLKGELAAYMESKPDQEHVNGGVLEDVLVDLEKKTRAQIESALSAARKELEEVKLNFEKATEEVDILKAAASSLKSELEKEKAELSDIQKREGMASIAIASLEDEMDKTQSEIAIIQLREKEYRERMVELPKRLQEAAQEADQAKSLALIAREELRKAKEEAEQVKAGKATTMSRLRAAKKEIEAAKASEKLALAAINALLESESNQDDDSSAGVTLSLEEYYELSKKAHGAEEQANERVADAFAEIELAKEAEMKALKKLQEASRETAERRSSLEAALQKAEKAKEGKLGAERELRKWRKSGEPLPRAVSGRRLETRRHSNMFKSAPLDQVSTGTDTSSEGKAIIKKKKRSFFPRMMMLLGKKKSQSSKSLH